MSPAQELARDYDRAVDQLAAYSALSPAPDAIRERLAGMDAAQAMRFTPALRAILDRQQPLEVFLDQPNGAGYLHPLYLFAHRARHDLKDGALVDEPALGVYCLGPEKRFHPVEYYARGRRFVTAFDPPFGSLDPVGMLRHALTFLSRGGLFQVCPGSRDYRPSDLGFVVQTRAAEGGRRVEPLIGLPEL